MQGVSEVSHRVDGAELLGEDVNGKSVETERFLTNEDFKRIKLLKKKQLYKKGIEKFAENTTGEKAAVKPEFDILYNRKKLKLITSAVANGEMEPEDVEHLDEQYEDEGVEQWKQQIDDFVDYKDQNASDDDDDSEEDLTKPYNRNHGFLSSNDMMKFVPNKEKRFEMARLEMKMKKLEGHGGKMTEKLKNRDKKTNVTGAKNKPYMMVADKYKNKVVDMYDKMRKTKNQMGKVSKRLQNKIGNKKNSSSIKKGRR